MIPGSIWGQLSPHLVRLLSSQPLPRFQFPLQLQQHAQGSAGEMLHICERQQKSGNILAVNRPKELLLDRRQAASPERASRARPAQAVGTRDIVFSWARAGLPKRSPHFPALQHAQAAT